MNKKMMCIAAAMILFAQANAQSIKSFVEGKKFVKVSKMDMVTKTEMMGQSMEQNMKNVTTAEVSVAAGADKDIKVEQKTTKIKMNMSMMGQEMEFDSEKPDENPQLKMMKDLINKVTTITTDEKGIVTDIKYDKDAEALMQGQSALAGTAKGQPLDFVLVLPAGATVGKTWNQTLTIEESKYDYTYTIKSIEGGIAKVDVVGKIDQNTKGEMQGMEVVTKLSGTSTGTISVDVKTNLVKNRTTKTDLKGNTEVMGQSVPTESSVITEDTFQ